MTIEAMTVRARQSMNRHDQQCRWRTVTGREKRLRRHRPRRSSLVALRFTERRLGGREAGDRHAEGRAAHVVHADLVAEVHAVGVAAVLAADADLQVLVVLRLPRLAALLDADVDELADAAHVDRLERIDRKDLLLEILADEALDVVAAE